MKRRRAKHGGRKPNNVAARGARGKHLRGIRSPLLFSGKRKAY